MATIAPDLLADADRAAHTISAEDDRHVRALFTKLQKAGGLSNGGVSVLAAANAALVTALLTNAELASQAPTPAKVAVIIATLVGVALPIVQGYFDPEQEAREALDEDPATRVLPETRRDRLMARIAAKLSVARDRLNASVMVAGISGMAVSAPSVARALDGAGQAAHGALFLPTALAAVIAGVGMMAYGAAKERTQALRDEITRRDHVAATHEELRGKPMRM